VETAGVEGAELEEPRPPPPQPKVAIASNIAPANPKRAGLRIFFICRIIVSRQRTIRTQINLGERLVGIHFVAAGAEPLAAPVVIIAEALTEPLAPKLAGLGETEQLAPAGAPEQEKLIIPE
jgi:hypothetical protein